MTLFEAKEFVALYDAIDNSAIDWDSRQVLKESLEKEFQKGQPSKNDGPSNAEISIAKGTFGTHPGAGYTPGEPNKIFAIKLYRNRTGLGLKEAKDAIDAAIGDTVFQLTEGEKEEIRIQSQKDDSSWFDKISHKIAHNRQITVAEAMKAVEFYNQTL